MYKQNIYCSISHFALKLSLLKNVTGFQQHLTNSSLHNMRQELSQVNQRKAAGPNTVPGKVLAACAVQLSSP